MKDWLEKLKEKTLEHNELAKIANSDGRDYVTPEDVEEAFKYFPIDKVRLDALEILGGGGTGFGYEAGDLIAFNAFNGPESN